MLLSKNVRAVKEAGQVCSEWPRNHGGPRCVPTPTPSPTPHAWVTNWEEPAHGCKRRTGPSAISSNSTHDIQAQKFQMLNFFIASDIIKLLNNNTLYKPELEAHADSLMPRQLRAMTGGWNYLLSTSHDHKRNRGIKAQVLVPALPVSVVWSWTRRLNPGGLQFPPP